MRHCPGVEGNVVAQVFDLELFILDFVKAQVAQAFDFGGHADFPQREVGAHQPLLRLWGELLRVPQQMASRLTAVDEVTSGYYQRHFPVFQHATVVLLIVPTRRFNTVA